MIGGYPRIIKNGQNYVNQGYNEEGGPPHTFERHPRTAIGFSQDSTRLYFITVDGRGYSIGMTLNELADFMIDIGAHEGINLDGGGSTTMLVRNRIMNVPSDGSERSVANSMLVYTSYPKTDTLSSISISPSNLRIFKGERISLKVEGWDKYYNPMSIESDKVKYFLDSQIGSLDSNGVFTAGESSGNALIFAEYLGFKDTCIVFVKSIGKIEVMPKEILINSVMPFELKHSAWDIDGVPKNIEKDKFQWSVQDTSIASVSSQGVVSGKTDGSTLIYLHYEELKDSAMVRVINMSGKHILHSFDNTENLSLIGKNLNLNNSFIELASDPKSEGNSSLKIIYEYTGNSSQIYDVGLKTNIPIEGVPDSIEVDLQTNGYRNQMIFFFSDDNGERFQLNVKKWADVSEYLDLQPGAFSNITATGIGDIFNFPVTLTEMSIKLSGPKEDGVIYKDSLYIDNLRISYPEIATGIEVENPILDYFKLNQNYPNPFNPLTKINYSIPFTSTGELSMKHVKLTVYDILGRKVKILVNEIQDPGNYEITFNGQNLNSGVYFYELRTGSFRSVKKMMLVK
jgi:hypothetical protein